MKGGCGELLAAPDPFHKTANGPLTSLSLPQSTMARRTLTASARPSGRSRRRTVPCLEGRWRKEEG